VLFRNLIVFGLPADWSIEVPALEEALAQRPLRPCGSFDMKTRGWVACDDTGQLVHAHGMHYLIALGVEQKLLPASIINQEARDRAVELAASQGHPVGRGQMRELKARVADELRARALTRRSTTCAWLNMKQHWLVVNTASAGRAEELVETLRDTLGTLSVKPLESKQAPQAFMSAWLSRGEAPGRFTLDQDLELKAVDGGAAIRYVRHPLDGNEIRNHLSAGKLPTRLGLTWNDRIAFVLHQTLHIKRVQFLDVFKDDNAQGENPQEQFDIDFALMAGELSQLLEELTAET
jgi:recombination associated protein RdgC